MKLLNNKVRIGFIIGIIVIMELCVRVFFNFKDIRLFGSLDGIRVYGLLRDYFLKYRLCKYF